MAGDSALAEVYASALERYAVEVLAMASAARAGGPSARTDDARAALRASGVWQSQVAPASRAWEASLPREVSAPVVPAEPEGCAETLRLSPEDAVLTHHAREVLVCELRRGHVGYHRDRDGGPFGPYRHPEAVHR